MINSNNNRLDRIEQIIESNVRAIGANSESIGNLTDKRKSTYKRH